MGRVSTQPGSNSEVGGRNREVRSNSESRLNSDIAPCPKRANEQTTRRQAGETERLGLRGRVSRLSQGSYPDEQSYCHHRYVHNCRQ
jgi:hypothetical protein